MRDRVDGLDVGRDVLAGDAVAAGERADQPALLVEQVDRQPVDLELAEQRRVLDAVARQPGVPGLELLVGERVVEALHPLQVVDGGELGRDRAADLLGRRVRRAQLGELLLELLEPAQPPVVVGVGQGGVVEHEVAPARLLDLLGEPLVLARAPRGVAWLGSLMALILPVATDTSAHGRPIPGAVLVRIDDRGRTRRSPDSDAPDAPRGRAAAARRQGALATRPVDGRSAVLAPDGGAAAGRSTRRPRTRRAPAPGCSATGCAAGTAAAARSTDARWALERGTPRARRASPSCCSGHSMGGRTAVARRRRPGRGRRGRAGARGSPAARRSPAWRASRCAPRTAARDRDHVVPRRRAPYVDARRRRRSPTRRSQDMGRVGPLHAPPGPAPWNAVRAGSSRSGCSLVQTAGDESGLPECPGGVRCSR